MPFQRAVEGPTDLSGVWKRKEPGCYMGGRKPGYSPFKHNRKARGGTSIVGPKDFFLEK